nr:aldo/keto reductase [Jiangella ureilytica]
MLTRTRELAAVCARHGVTLPQAALHYVLRHPLVRSAVVGMRTPAEVGQNAAHLGTAVPDELWADLAGSGLIAAGAASAPAARATP